MDELANELSMMFIKANKKLLSSDISLFRSRASERTLCGALKQHLDSCICKTKFAKYHVDVEYNRNKNGKIKTCCPPDEHGIPSPVTINCDLIVHSRGEIISQDNLIAIEMKKSNRRKKEKGSDRQRLIALTKDSYDGVWSYDGVTLPEHVCGYKLGVYYEINFARNEILIEYYYKGVNTKAETIKLA